MAEVNFSESLDRLKESFLWVAAQSGNTQDCDSLLEIGAQVNWKNAEGDTPLHAACRRGHDKTISTLLVHGADVNMTGADSRTPLQICCERGDVVSANLVLQTLKCNLNLKTREGLTAMDIAKAKGHIAVFELVKKFSPAISSESKRGDDSDEEFHVQSESKGVDAKSQPSARLATPRSSSPHSSARTGSAVSTTAQEKRTTISSSSGTQPIQAKQSYTLIGQDVNSTVPDEAVRALRSILETEQRRRKSSEQEVEELKKEVERCKTEIVVLKLQVDDIENERDNVQQELNSMQGYGLEFYNMTKCNQLERTLKSALENVEIRKAQLVREELEQQREQRVCVICQVAERSIVLLPCRHLCLCANCSEHDSLQDCPLCRQAIVHKFSVFS